MKITEGLKIINEGWIKKPKGFRVQYQRLVEGALTSEISPPEAAAPLDSDVTAWRYARKLFLATRRDGQDIQAGEFVNIHVVDDAGEKVKYYATNEFEVFNSK